MLNKGQLVIVAFGNVHTSVGIITGKADDKKWKVRTGPRKDDALNDTVVTEKQIVDCGWIDLSDEERDFLDPKEVLKNHVVEVLAHLIRLTALGNKTTYLPPN